MSENHDPHDSDGRILTTFVVLSICPPVTIPLFLGGMVAHRVYKSDTIRSGAKRVLMGALAVGAKLASSPAHR